MDYMMSPTTSFLVEPPERLFVPLSELAKNSFYWFLFWQWYGDKYCAYLPDYHIDLCPQYKYHVPYDSIPQPPIETPRPHIPMPAPPIPKQFQPPNITKTIAKNCYNLRLIRPGGIILDYNNITKAEVELYSQQLRPWGRIQVTPCA